LKGWLSALPIGVALALILVSALAPFASRGQANGTSRVYLPAISVASLPTPTPTPAGCQPIPGASYGSASISGSPTNIPAAIDPDLNLLIRGWQQTSQPLSFVTYSGVPDSRAPQLKGLFGDHRVPSFTSAYQVYDWNWASNSRGSLLTNWPVTLLGMGVSPGEEIEVPNSGYSIGSGYNALVLYATNTQITLKYTRADNVVYGYTIHVEGVCVEPSLLALYNQLNAAGRASLPALTQGQPFGRANYGEIQVAIRDSGEFMDPRSQPDWWQ